MCGGGAASTNKGWWEDIQLIYFEVPHFADSATVSMISKLNQAATDESWGFRDVHVLTRNADGEGITADFTGVEFADIDEEWVITDPVVVGVVTSDCGGKTLLGGYNTFSGKTSVVREWTDLPVHDFVTFYFKAYFIDSWDKEAFLA